MITPHVTDIELQHYITEPEVTNRIWAVHIKACPYCSARAANYSVLFKALGQTAQPVFDFDLDGQVMSALPVKKTPYPWLPLIAGSLGAVLVLSASIFFGTRLAPLLDSMPAPLLWLLILPAVVLLVMQAVAIWGDYRRKMASLLSS